MEYALINLSSNELIERRFFNEVPPDVSHKGIKWLPLTVIRPACDVYTQVEEGPVITINATDVTITYTVRNLTPEELYTKKFNEINSELFGAGKFTGTAQLYVLNQTRTSQGLPTLNNNQFIDLIIQSLTPPETDINQ